MPQILISKAVKAIAKSQNKQLGKDFLELLDRKIYLQVEKIITGVRFKRLTSKDLIQ